MEIIGEHLSDNVATLAARPHNVQAQIANYFGLDKTKGMTPYAIRLAEGLLKKLCFLAPGYGSSRMILPPGCGLVVCGRGALGGFLLPSLH